MRHSYATWMLEAGADLRWVKAQLGHASIEETEGTYGHLERERHGRRVDLDAVLGVVQPRPPASTLLDAGGATEGQLRDTSREDFMVEGKGFVASTLLLSAYLAAITCLQTALECPLEPFRVPIRPRFRGVPASTRHGRLAAG